SDHADKATWGLFGRDRWGAAPTCPWCPTTRTRPRGDLSDATGGGAATGEDGAGQVHPSAACEQGRCRRRLSDVYTLLSASILAIDLARHPSGTAVADTVDRVLALTAQDL